MKTIIIYLFISSSLFAQVVTAVAPLKPGNRWIYVSYIAGDYSHPRTIQFVVTDSIKIINGISFYAVNGGGFMGIVNNEFFARYDATMADSLYRYLKTTITIGDTWAQKWNVYFSSNLYSAVIDTFSAQVFGKNTLIYVIDRTDSVVVGSREYWTKEYGMLNGLYEQAEDILKGCVIDGVLYGDTTVTGIEDVKELPDKFVLYQNYPNPFNPGTVISWEVAVGGFVTIKVYDVLGREIRALVTQYYNQGKYSVYFNGEGLPSGIYFYRIVTKNFIQTKKIMLLR